jgi:hypothetical protein
MYKCGYNLKTTDEWALNASFKMNSKLNPLQPQKLWNNDGTRMSDTGARIV